MRRSIFEADHEALRASVRAFLDRHVRGREPEFRAAHVVPRDVWVEAGKQGFLGLGLPGEHGGAGVQHDLRFLVVWLEELAQVSMGISSSFGIHTAIVPPYLVDLGTAEQQARWLPGMASGELKTAIAMTEPSAGSDLAALTTTATWDGDGWVLEGSKTFITNGASADLVLVAARSDPAAAGARGISLFAVEAGAPGFTRGRPLEKVGQEDADTAELFFAAVRVPAANLVGEPGRGFVHLMERLPQERISAAVQNLAHVQAALAATVEYCRQRTAFGVPIGSLQHNKFLLAELVTQVEVAQAYVDRCVMEAVAGRLSAVDAAKAKWWTAQVQNDVLDACVQLHGGYGYMTEYPVARAWRDARVTKIWAGSNEIMKELIGRDLGL